MASRILQSNTYPGGLVVDTTPPDQAAQPLIGARGVFRAPGTFSPQGTVQVMGNLENASALPGEARRKLDKNSAYYVSANPAAAPIKFSDLGAQTVGGPFSPEGEPAVPGPGEGMRKLMSVAKAGLLAVPTAPAPTGPALPVSVTPPTPTPVDIPSPPTPSDIPAPFVRPSLPTESDIRGNMLRSYMQGGGKAAQDLGVGGLIALGTGVGGAAATQLKSIQAREQFNLDQNKSAAETAQLQASAAKLNEEAKQEALVTEAAMNSPRSLLGGNADKNSKLQFVQQQDPKTGFTSTSVVDPVTGAIVPIDKYNQINAWRKKYPGKSDDEIEAIIRAERAQSTQGS